MQRAQRAAPLINVVGFVGRVYNAIKTLSHCDNMAMHFIPLAFYCASF